MPKSFSQTIVLLLLPCLLVDPSTAAAFSPIQTTHLSLLNNPAPFNEEALQSSLIWMHKISGPWGVRLAGVALAGATLYAGSKLGLSAGGMMAVLGIYRLGADEDFRALQKFNTEPDLYQLLHVYLVPSTIRLFVEIRKAHKGTFESFDEIESEVDKAKEHKNVAKKLVIKLKNALRVVINEERNGSANANGSRVALPPETTVNGAAAKNGHPDLSPFPTPPFVVDNIVTIWPSKVPFKIKRWEHKEPRVLYVEVEDFAGNSRFINWREGMEISVMTMTDAEWEYKQTRANAAILNKAIAKAAAEEEARKQFQIANAALEADASAKKGNPETHTPINPGPQPKAITDPFARRSNGMYFKSIEILETPEGKKRLLEDLQAFVHEAEEKKWGGNALDILRRTLYGYSLDDVSKAEYLKGNFDSLQFKTLIGLARTIPRARVRLEKRRAEHLELDPIREKVLLFMERLLAKRPELLELWANKSNVWHMPETQSIEILKRWLEKQNRKRLKNLEKTIPQFEWRIERKNKQVSNKGNTLAPGASGWLQTHLGWTNVKSIGRFEGFLQSLILFSLILTMHYDPKASYGWHFALWSVSFSFVFGVVPFLIHYYSGVVNPYDDKPKIRDFKAALGATALSLISLGSVGLLFILLGQRLHEFSSVWFVQTAAYLSYLGSFYSTSKLHAFLNVLTTLFSEEKKDGQFIHRLPTDIATLPVFGEGPDPVVSRDPDEPQETRWFRTIWFSDTHMGFRAFLSRHFLDFLRLHESLYLYAVGDVFDFWVFSVKKLWFWTETHNTILQKILRKARKGTQTIIIPGNHDEVMRPFSPLVLGGIHIENAAIHVAADGKRYLIIHGDELDTIIRVAKWLSKLGSWAYDFMYVLNPLVNYFRKTMGMPQWSLAAYAKKRVKEATVFIDNFKYEAAKAAKNLACDGVICGHIHEAADEIIYVDGTPIRYLNPGSWVEGPDGTSLVEEFDGMIHLIHWHELFGIRDDAKALAELRRSA